MKSELEIGRSPSLDGRSNGASSIQMKGVVPPSQEKKIPKGVLKQKKKGVMGTQWKKKNSFWTKNRGKMSKRSQKEGCRVRAIIGATAPGNGQKFKIKDINAQQLNGHESQQLGNVKWRDRAKELALPYTETAWTRQRAAKYRKRSSRSGGN
ncbi:hypothetical protein H6P81_015931 [Aristolochia fimbriata]|uniref:HNH homing endonuclease n=1 Tax=Aristolochia fimbriata TaxID=158543 RepID=A0AAV7E857_ARIFI|nr:hypothetical protein H6P81_015931 [Aristolochia fimbriata]